LLKHYNVFGLESNNTSWHPNPLFQVPSLFIAINSHVYASGL